MRGALTWMLWLMGCLVFPLRYRVRVEGLNEVGRPNGTLILANHPAYVDPLLVLHSLWPRLRPRPLLLAAMFGSPLIAWLPRVVGAITVPKIDRHSTADRKQTEAAIDAVVAGLGRGTNHILWPAGRARRGDLEALGAVRSPAEILHRAREISVVLVRTRGLWGSTFSYARTGRQPNLMRCLARGIGILLANLVLFTPRRDVTITIERIESDQFTDLDRDGVNRLLERWYNEPGPEPPTHVPYHFWLGGKGFEFPRPAATGPATTRKVSDRTRTAVAQMLADKLEHPLDDGELSPQTTLESLGLDSLDRVDFSLAVEQRFGFTSDGVALTVGDVEALAEGLADRSPPPPPPSGWFDPPAEAGNASLKGRTIEEALVQRALDHPHDVVAADDISGRLTYGRFLAAALALSGP
ncbi:MAG: phosphopantetheine-binding protein, partial [Vicinamibacterales bacterium]|nr:phosphopantetheine-binding protein [Vicinamibacterales bacterium]